jgi:integrase/recombinase XerC
MSARGCAKDIERWCRRYGVRPEAAHPHGLRHRFALDFLARSGKDIALLQTLMGHESIETTSVYLKMSSEEVRKAFEDAMGEPAKMPHRAGLIG